jgi:hypothetical protein
MAQPPGTARYYPYNGIEQWTTEGYATASFSPSAVGVNQVYWFAMTVAFSGSNKFAVWDPQTDLGDELDIQFMNGSTHYVSASAEAGVWDLYTPDSIYPVMNIKFEVQNPGLNTYTINFNQPETWSVVETFTGISVSGVDYIMQALPAGLGYSVPIYVLCACTRYENPPSEDALELTCGKIMLNSSGAEPQLMMMQMSAEENAGVLTSVRESVWWQKVVSLVFGGVYQPPVPPSPTPPTPEPPVNPVEPADDGPVVPPVDNGGSDGSTTDGSNLPAPEPPTNPVDEGGSVDPIIAPTEPPPGDESDVGDGTQLGHGDGEYAGPDSPILPPEPMPDPGYELVQSIQASGKVELVYVADSGYNRMYVLAQAQLSSPMSVLGTSSIGPNLIQTNQGTYWYGVLEDRDNDGFFETIVYGTDQDGMGGTIETYPSELVGLYVTQAPPGTQVAEPNIFSITSNEGSLQISMHSIVGIADQYLAVMKTPQVYFISQVHSTAFTTTPTV